MGTSGGGLSCVLMSSDLAARLLSTPVLRCSREAMLGNATYAACTRAGLCTAELGHA